MTTRIVGTKAIKGAIANIKINGKALDASIQEVGLAVLAHASEYGDSTLADALVNAMPKGSRRLALVEWLLAFGQMRKLNKDEPAEALRIGKGALFCMDRTRKLDIQSAEAKLWHTMGKPEAHPLTAFDAQSAVRSLLKRLNDAAAKGLRIENREQALAEARALLVALEAGDAQHEEAPL